MSRPWTYNHTTGAYQLSIKNGFLDVNTRFSDVGVVFREQKDGVRWTYSIGVDGGERWTHLRTHTKSEEVSREDALTQLQSYKTAFKTEGLPKKGRALVETVLRALAEQKQEIVS